MTGTRSIFAALFVAPLVNPHARPFIKRAYGKRSCQDYATGRGWYGSVVLEFLRGSSSGDWNSRVPSPGAVFKVTTRLISWLFPPSNCNSLHRFFSLLDFRGIYSS